MDMRVEPALFSRHERVVIQDALNVLKQVGFAERVIDADKQRFLNDFDRAAPSQVAASLVESKHVWRAVRVIFGTNFATEENDDA